MKTFEEGFRNFPDLKMYCYYSTLSIISADDPRKERKLTTALMEQYMEQWHKNRGDPEKARVVVLSTYPTLSKRWLSAADTEVRYDPDQHDLRPWGKGRAVPKKFALQCDLRGPDDTETPSTPNAKRGPRKQGFPRG